MKRQNTPFPNHVNFVNQIEAKIEPNRQFPFVQLQPLDEEKLQQYLQKKNDSKSANPNFKCHLCSHKFVYQVKLTSHLRNDHPEVEKPFACSVCPDSYKTRKELNLHLGKEHPEEFHLVIRKDIVLAKIKNRQCPHCPKKFSCEALLKKHILFHTKEQTYVCGVCGTKYRHAFDLKKHKVEKKCKQVMELQLSKVFQCDYCEVAVGSKKYLTRHMQIDHGIGFIQPKKVDCLFCGYKAPDSVTLQRHNIFHTGEKNFGCKACNKAFALKHNLDAHIRSHCQAAKAMGLEPDVKPKASIKKNESDVRDAQGRFKCSICDDATFKNRSERNSHEETHGDKFMCQFCPVGFQHKVALTWHEFKMHPEQMKTFKCTNCDTVCFTKVGLKKHQWECPGRKSELKKEQDETEDKEEGQGSMTVSASYMIVKVGDVSSSPVVNSTLSWNKSVTNNSTDQLGLGHYDSGVIPITVLKMEH